MMTFGRTNRQLVTGFSNIFLTTQLVT